MSRHCSFLALGDSYTIGESLPLHFCFPVQLVQLLRKEGHSCNAPEILARTGWTTGELLEATAAYQFKRSYDFVTLLAGVNNQYRGLSLSDYGGEMRQLLELSISLAGWVSERVLVISIPDWGCTPYAGAKDIAGISGAIDAFNGVARDLAQGSGSRFLDITSYTREVPEHPEWLAADGLHYAPGVYADWAKKIYPLIIKYL